MFGTGICDKIHHDECESETGTVLLENKEFEKVYKLNPKVSEEWKMVGTLDHSKLWHEIGINVDYEELVVIPFEKATEIPGAIGT